jgi:LPXTG-motif cell wall-anchored protein
LPVTGGSSTSAVLLAGIGVLLGLGMTMLARRRRSA